MGSLMEEMDQVLDRSSYTSMVSVGLELHPPTDNTTLAGLLFSGINLTMSSSWDLVKELTSAHTWMNLCNSSFFICSSSCFIKTESSSIVKTTASPAAMK